VISSFIKHPIFRGLVRPTFDQGRKRRAGTALQARRNCRVNPMAQVCYYEVISVPPGCTEYTVGETVEGPCDGGSCQDIIVGAGPCADAYLMALSCACEESEG
jgi:hypothetical protein